MSEIKTFQDGNAWCATFNDFKNLEESPAGFGNCPEDAIEALLKETLKQANAIMQDIKPEQEYADSLIAKVRNHIFENQSEFECDIAKVTYRHGSVSYTYDKKALDKYAEGNQEILKYRKISESKATTALKWLN